MLHRETVSASTLDLLRALSGHAALQSFHLAGGTSLALRFGHRLSVDLDFFSADPFDNEALCQALVRDFGFDERRRGETGVAGSIAGVRLDFVKYRYPLIAVPEVMEGIRFISLPDVIAMKLSAVTNRGAKKDFYDLQMLITKFGLPTLFEHYQKKYPQAGVFMLARSISHFDDAEDEDDEPVSLIGMTWEGVKDGIQNAVKGMM
jgi:predicted nucleotidyltransferase component of viral defense system